MGIYAESRRHLEESIAIGREIGEKLVTTSALQPLGMACLGQGDLEAARRHLEEALVRARELEDPRNIAAAINAIAQLHRVDGNLDAAEPLYGHVLDLARELEDRESVTIGLLNLSMTAIERGRWETGRDYLREALSIVEATMSKPAGQSVLEVCAGLAVARRQWPAAARFYGMAEGEAAKTGIRRDPADEAFLSPRMAEARRALGEEAFLAGEQEGRALSFGPALKAARAWLDESATC